MGVLGGGGTYTPVVVEKKCFILLFNGVSGCFKKSGQVVSSQLPPEIGVSATGR